MGRNFVHKPLPAERKSGTPDGVEIPAPVKTTVLFADFMIVAAFIIFSLIFEGKVSSLSSWEWFEVTKKTSY